MPQSKQAGFFPPFLEKYEMYVDVNSIENTPHFHIRDNKDYKKVCTITEETTPISTSIKFETCEYFLHHNSVNQMSEMQTRQMYDFINSFSYKDYTYFQWAINIWNTYNSNKISLDTEMPTYLKKERNQKAYLESKKENTL